MNLDVERVVWAKFRGPFWPSVITKETSTGLFKKGGGKSAKFHVRFLGADWAPAWVLQCFLREFQKDDTGPDRKAIYRVGPTWEAEHNKAMEAGFKLLEKVDLFKTSKEQQQVIPPLEQDFKFVDQELNEPDKQSELETPQKNSNLAEVPKKSSQIKNSLKSKSSENILKKESVDTSLRRSGRHSTSSFVREEPDLISAVQWDSDWKNPYKCRLCHSRFAWNLERDSHELSCRGDTDVESEDRIEVTKYKEVIDNETYVGNSLVDKTDKNFNNMSINPFYFEENQCKEETEMVSEEPIDLMKNQKGVGGLNLYPEEQKNLIKTEVNCNDHLVNKDADESTENNGYKRTAGNIYSELEVFENKYDMIKKRRKGDNIQKIKNTKTDDLTAAGSEITETFRSENMPGLNDENGNSPIIEEIDRDEMNRNEMVVTIKGLSVTRTIYTHQAGRSQQLGQGGSGRPFQGVQGGSQIVQRPPQQNGSRGSLELEVPQVQRPRSQRELGSSPSSHGFPNCKIS